MLKTKKSKIIILLLLFIFIVSFWLIQNRLLEEMVDKACLNLDQNISTSQPALNDQQVTRVIAIGDSGEAGAGLQKLSTAIQAYCQQQGCDFGLMLGDNFYENGVQTVDDPYFDNVFRKYWQPVQLPFYVILGNHDVKKNSKAQVDYSLHNKLWLMPNYNYTFSIPQAEFYALNTNCPPLYNFWLADNIKPSDKWQIVLGHHSAYSTGPHGDTSKVNNFLQDKLVKHNIDLQLSGHNHILEFLQDQDNKRYFVVSGAASRPKTGAEVHDSDQESLFRYDQFGYVWLEIAASQILIRFLDSDNNLLYQHIIKRS